MLIRQSGLWKPASNAGNIQGTGLGLHIVSKYVEMMNGKIKCNSEIEKGSEFTLVFEKEG